jgi:lysozyme family protein
MVNRLTIADYLRLAKANPTVEKEFEYFKEHIFNRTLVWEGVSNPKVGGNWPLWGIVYNSNAGRFNNFDNFKDINYEEAAALAYTKYYRAINAFILPLESRLMYFDIAYNMGNNRAIKLMQGCAKVPNDGIIGPATREKMQYVTEECLYNARNTTYNNLVKANRSLGRFLKGWLNRSIAIFKIK